MNIDNSVKINNIARELLKHGLVSTLDEGVGKAKEMVKEGVSINEDENNVQQSSETNPSEKEELTEQPSQASDQGTDIRIVERKLNYLAKSFAEQFNDEMGLVKKQIEALNTELSVIKGQIKQQQSKPQEEQQKLEIKETHEQKKKDDEEIKPRTGDLTPDNVELEDYFYYGNKKK